MQTPRHKSRPPQGKAGLALSLILCSRNDQYMGNSLWRLQTSLNYVAHALQELRREADVELLVADWGSDIPLRDSLALSPTAAGLVSFILIPPSLARHLQKDSPFAEVLALNAAARRAGGAYIGRIDQDTLVGKRFIEHFFDLYEGRRHLAAPLDTVMLFSNQRMVPYRFTVRSPSLWAVQSYIECFGRRLKVEITSELPFYDHGVGIWLLHRRLWIESGGYDERMIYMNAMESNMIARLMPQHEMVNLGELVNFDFYHLEHYHPHVPRRSSTYRKVNPVGFLTPQTTNPNGSEWGLAGHHFRRVHCRPDPSGWPASRPWQAPLNWMAFALLLAASGTQMVWDNITKNHRFRAPLPYLVWKRRAHIAWEAMRERPWWVWPQVLAMLRAQKRANQRGGRPGGSP